VRGCVDSTSSTSGKGSNASSRIKSGPGESGLGIVVEDGSGVWCVSDRGNEEVIAQASDLH
jgi:hypothetical protein